jgi:hypothetical protein
MRLVSRLLFFLCLLLGLTWSCTQAVTIGSDFLEDQKSDLKFLDNFTMNFYTEKTDSIITYSPNVSYQLVTYLLGNLNDPIFGHSSASIYTQPQLPVAATDLIGSRLDSVILQLRYDTLGLYGDQTTEVTLDVYQLRETPDYTKNYYSNQSFDYNPNKIGSVKFVPHPRDSIIVTYNGDTVKSAPHIRVPIDTSAFRELLAQDSSVFTDQSKFQDFFHGIYIRMSGADNTMLGIALLNSLSGMVFYYDTPIEEDHIYKMVFNTFRVNMVNFNHDYRGSPVGTALDPSPDNNNWYVQGMSGVKSYVTIDGLDQIPNAVINQAVLEFYASFPPGDDEVLYPPCNYLIAQEQTDSTLNYDTDVRLALAVAQGNHLNSIFDLVFGGKRSDPIPGPPTVYKYEMKVTNRIKEILAGNKENIIYFNPFSKEDYPHRAVLFGPNSTIYPPRLRVTYTVL